MTSTFSIVLVFRVLVLAVTMPMAVLCYIKGWKILLDNDLDCTGKMGGLILWAGSLLAIGATYLAITMKDWSWV